MRIIQKILSYGLLITFMVALFMMFQNRDQLFPQWFAKDKSSPLAYKSSTGTVGKNASKISRAEPAKKVLSPEMEEVSSAGQPEVAIEPEQKSAVLEKVVVASEQNKRSPDSSNYRSLEADDSVEGVEKEVNKVNEADNVRDALGQEAALSDSDPIQAEQDDTSLVIMENTAEEETPVEAATEPEQESIVIEKVVAASEPHQPSPGAANYRPLETEKPVVVAGSDADKERGKANETTKVIDEVNLEPATPNRDSVQLKQDHAPLAKVETVAEEKTPAPVNTAEIVSRQEEPLSSSPVVTSEKDSNAVQESLENARSLYWKRDVEAAVFAYQQVVTTDPNHAQAWGELGNLYFNHGRWAEAADSYYAAGMLLVDQGDPERASQILRVLYGLDSAKGEKLQKRLESSGK